jgi:hypothetical protein
MCAKTNQGKTTTLQLGGHGKVDTNIVLDSATKWLGSNYTEIAPGIFRSADGTRQFRMTDSDLNPDGHGKKDGGTHVHFESLNNLGESIENLHIYIK